MCRIMRFCICLGFVIILICCASAETGRVKEGQENVISLSRIEESNDPESLFTRMVVRDIGKVEIVPGESREPKPEYIFLIAEFKLPQKKITIEKIDIYLVDSSGTKWYGNFYSLSTYPSKAWDGVRIQASKSELKIISEVSPDIRSDKVVAVVRGSHVTTGIKRGNTLGLPIDLIKMIFEVPKSKIKDMKVMFREKEISKVEAMKEALSKIEDGPDLGRTEQLKPPTESPEVSPSSSISKEYVKQGLSHAKAGRHNEAAEAFKNAILNNPNDALGHYNLSVCYVYLKRFREAVESGEKAINIRPDFAPSYANLCAAYGGLKRYQEAVEACNKAIAFKPDYAEAYVNLCLTYGHVGRYQEAVEPCKKAIGLNPNFAMAHYTLGIIYTRLRDKEAAIQQYKILKNLDESRANNLLRMVKEMP